MLILSINAGSTSLKCCLFDLPADPAGDQNALPIWQADLSWQGESQGKLKIVRLNEKSETELSAPSRDQAIDEILAGMWQPGGPIKSPDEIIAVAHRIVHGGLKYSRSTLIDDQVIADLRGLEELSPNHGKENVRGVLVAKQMLPKALQVAVFDTAFHHNLPLTSAVYAVPYHWYEHDGIRRYGFHGISLEYLAGRAPQLMAGQNQNLKLIACHLGGGSSVSAIAGGKSLDTSMGFTPLEGVPMQTRSGSIDPGLVAYQLKHAGYSVDELNTVLTKESGMKGLSGLSGDMKEIEAAMITGDSRAQLAFDIFVMGVAKFAASLVPVLGSVDALIFAGGIGENSSIVRAAVCNKLAHLGIAIDETANTAGKGDRDISSPQGKVKVLVIFTKEELAMAQSARQLFMQPSRT